MPVRALLRAAQVDGVAAPYNQIQLEIFYPAREATTQVHRQTGILPFDERWSPAPVVIFLPGVNCSAHTYIWLASALAEQGIVTILTSWVAENLPGRISITPGIDLAALQHEQYGTRPTSSSLATIVAALNTLHDDAVLAGNLRQDYVFGGHSAGGTMAIQNARREWFPQVIGAFSYAAHPLATAALGDWGTGVVPPNLTDVPVLVMGATHDGIGDHHTNIFAETDESGAAFISRAFNEAAYENSTLCIFEGANHHTICHPLDPYRGRTFMDSVATGDEARIRSDMSQLIIEFVQGLMSPASRASAELEPPVTAEIWQQV